MKPIIKGMSMHCHHDILFEYCTNYRERVDYIEKRKPKNEQVIRLERFRMLTKEETAMLPAKYVEASQKWKEADQKWKEADQKRKEASQKWKEASQKWKEADQKWNEADQKRKEADQKWNEADQKWNEADQKRKEAKQKYNPQLEEIHKKICGCKEWDGEELVFK